MMNVLLTFRNGIARFEIERDDRPLSVQHLYAPNQWAARRDVSRWARSQGFEPISDWARAGVSVCSRRFRRLEAS